MIELSALEKTFEQPGGERVPALRGVDLAIPAGQFLTVIGSNGSGKSTILNVIAGTYLTDTGTIRIAESDVTRWPEHKRAGLLGRVFQDPFKGTCPSMTVAENLRMAELRGKRRGLRFGPPCSARTVPRTASILDMRLEGVSMSRWGRCPWAAPSRDTAHGDHHRARICCSSTNTAALDPRAEEQVMRVTEHLTRTRCHVDGHTQHGAGGTFGDRTMMMHRGLIVADLTGERHG
jgi:putative ABC transport system ATP-binding protein